MLAADAARVTRARLADLTHAGRPLRLHAYPEVYGVLSTPSVQDLTVNAPQGWVMVLKPRSVGMGHVDGRWTVTVQVAAPRGVDPLPLAQLVTRRLHHSPRHPTGFTFMGDEDAGITGPVRALNLSFLANIRHQE